MKILVTGSTGLIGRALISLLATKGQTIVRMTRTRPREERSAVYWNPSQGMIDSASIEGIDAAVHLAGENIGAKRWTKQRKAEIRDSRLMGTRLLSETLAKLRCPPKVMVSGSAMGYYGNRGDELLTEESSPGRGFLSELCREWEVATEPAGQAGIRVVHLRTGFVLSPKGGGLARMLLPFRLGLGGRIGDGSQFMSWISIDDLTASIHHALLTETLSGPVNAVAPQAATNREFTRMLGSVLGRPTLFPVPAIVARLALGELADELLLASTRVSPMKLLRTGFQFLHPELEAALRHVLGRAG